MKPRVSIGQLLTLMVPIAIGMCAVTLPSQFWEGTVFVLTIALLFTAIVGVLTIARPAAAEFDRLH